VVTSEEAAYNHDTTRTVDQKDLVLKKYTKELRVSEEFLGARNSNWENWIAGALARAEAGTENAVATAALVDDSGATAATAAGSSTTLTAAELARLVGSLTNGYNVLGECGFLMKNATKWYLKGLTGSNFNFIATPAGADFFGYPAYVSDDMAAMTSGSYSTLFGNFNYFAVVENAGAAQSLPVYGKRTCRHLRQHFPGIRRSPERGLLQDGSGYRLIDTMMNGGSNTPFTKKENKNGS